MKKLLLLFTLLLVSVMTTACINNLAVEELNSKAVKYMNNGDTEAAICRLKSSLDLDDEIYQTHYNLALAYNTVGNFDGAVEELNKVLQLKPDFYDALYSLAVAKEGQTYAIINKEPDEQGNVPELTNEEMNEFSLKALEVIDIYQKYIIQAKVADDETSKINSHIDELNAQIKDFSYKLSNQKQEDDITSPSEDETVNPTEEQVSESQDVE